MRRVENRRRLADATAKYFEQLPAKVQIEEQELAEDLSAVAGAIDFDNEI
jgi:hypothetical protein